MKSKWIALLVILVLSGCATQDHHYVDGECVTCFNNPITGEPLNYDPEEAPQRVAQNTAEKTVGLATLESQRGAIDIESSLDVDTAYARIKPAFGFKSREDFDMNDRDDRFYMTDDAWKYDATPGAYYHLSDYGRQAVGGVEYSIVQRVQIQKNGSGSRIHYSWAPADGRTRYDGNAMESAIEQRLKAALQ